MCNSIRSQICTPGECLGELCPQQNTTECGSSLSCRGIFSRAGSSIQTARKTAQEIHKLSIRLQEATQMVGVQSRVGVREIRIRSDVTEDEGEYVLCVVNVL